jgi:uncharacterized membrane protein
MPALPFLSVDPALLSTGTSFLFVFAIVFGLLSFTKLFVQKDKEGNPVGKEPRMLYAILALVFGIIAVSYEPLVAFIQQILPPAIGLFVIIFFFAFLKEIFRKKRAKEEKHPLQTLAVLALLLIVLAAFWEDISRITGIASLVSPGNLFVLVGIAIIVMIFYTVSKVEETAKEK